VARAETWKRAPHLPVRALESTEKSCGVKSVQTSSVHRWQSSRIQQHLHNQSKCLLQHMEAFYDSKWRSYRNKSLCQKHIVAPRCFGMRRNGACFAA